VEALVIAFGLGSVSCLVSFLCCNQFRSGTDQGTHGGVLFTQGVLVLRLVWVRGCGLVRFHCSNLFISGIDYYRRHEVFGSLRVYSISGL